MDRLRLPLLSLLLAFQGGEDYFPLKEGLAWSFKATILQGGRKTEVDALTRVTGRKEVGGTNCFVVEVTVGGIVYREHIAVDKEGVKVFGGGQGAEDFTYGTPIMRLRVPLRKDDSWESRARRGDVEAVCRSKVAAEEVVEVPAGKFRAFKVVIEMESPAGRTESHSWFARDVGMVKQWVRQGSAVAQTELTIDLKGFKGA